MSNSVQPLRKKPFILYSASDEGALRTIVDTINTSLEVKLPYFPYCSDIEEETLLEELDNSDFVILVFTRTSVEDPVFLGAFTEAANRNKTFVPLLYGVNSVPSRFSLRTKSFVWDNSDDRDKALVLLHSLLSLDKRGDAIGAKVYLASDVPCRTFRGSGASEFLAVVNSGMIPSAYVKLSKGEHLIKFVADDGRWNIYKVTVSSNVASSFTLTNKMRIMDAINRNDSYPVVKGKVDYDADLPEDGRYKLHSSSLDRKKFDIIVRDFNDKYKRSKVAPPKLHTHELIGIEFPGWLDGLVYFGAAALCFYPLWKLIWLIVIAMIYLFLAICTLFIICFFWNPLPEAWEEFTGAFSWSLIWGFLIVAGYWGIKILLAVLLTGGVSTAKAVANTSRKLDVNSENSKIASRLNDELGAVLARHNMRIVKVDDSMPTSN